MKYYTNDEAREIIKKPAIGYWSAFGGVEVKDIEYGTNDYIVCVANAWYGPKPNNVHRLRIRTTTPSSKFVESRNYICLGSTHLYLDECLRV